MPVPPTPCDDLRVTTAAPGTETGYSSGPDNRNEPAPRRLYRSADGRWLGGVARGLAGHLGLPVSWVRIVFLALFLAQGLGALLYAAFWFVVPLGVGGARPGTQDAAHPGGAAGRHRGLVGRRPDKGRVLALVMLLIGAGVLAARFPSARGGPYLWPLLLIGVGVALVWRQADNARRAQWLEMGRGKGALPLLRVAAGVLLVAMGVSAFVVLRGTLHDLGAVLQAAVAVVVGIALLAGPYLVRMAQDLSEERLMRIRAQERAEVAAHVHDSVLHTLTLIQRNADNPREVARLARAQERELRNWLYEPRDATAAAEEAEREPTRLAEAVRRAAAEVEDKHGVPMEVVVVGDCDLDERLEALIKAAREAMVNAAKYGGEGGAVQVFAEVEGRTVFVSVRDRGPGFDPENLPEDRMGVRESIIGRMRRHGGTARIRPAPDGGTMVELETERAA
ncbi:PspC domain-containing protein [Streptomyces sp. NPDC059740]|uniref:ATP-binding protein n=1 Tax=Streptomyces sp. NPDC059740 TaxID=3346926 RepID=UPI003653988B